MNPRILYAMASLTAASIAAAQTFTSPEVHDDRTVTFRFQAPRAETVRVQGIAQAPDADMKPGPEGIWAVTLGPLPAGIYDYTFSVDGATTLDPKNREVKRWIDSVSTFEVPGDPPLLHEVRDVPHGTLHRQLYTSTTVEREREVFVYTPPGYLTAGEGTLPVLYLMHGYGDDASGWPLNGRVPAIFDNLLAEGRIEPLIIVMPHGHPVPVERNREFDDYAAENLAVYEREYFADLIPFVERHYRIAPGPQNRAIAGLSMGGGQSLAIGLRHPDTFAWVGAFSAACPQGDIAAQLPALAEDPGTANDRFKLLWIACGEDDFLFERNERFVAWLEEHGIDHTWERTAGAHDWSVWRRYLAEFLPLLFK